MKNMKRSILLVLVLLFTGHVFITSAQQKVIPPPESDRTTSNRDIIKYLFRVELGLASGQVTFNNPYGEFIFTGLAVPMDFQLGIGIFPRTYIHAALGATFLNKPSYSFNNIDYTYEGTYTMFDFGVGFTVYPFTQKIYASGTIYGTTLYEFYQDEVNNSEIGVGFKLKGGIDFMLGSAFSFGASAFLYYAGMKSQPDTEGTKMQINDLVIGICLTATLGNL